MPKTEYLTKKKFDELEQEKQTLREQTIPQLAKRIDEARQMGDLSENAEYHSAREEMAWAQGRVQEIDQILDNAELITKGSASDKVSIGSTIVVEVKGKERTYMIVGAQESDPLEGKISNESPLGEAFLGKEVGDTIEVNIPAGTQSYTIKSIA